MSKIKLTIIIIGLILLTGNLSFLDYQFFFIKKSPTVEIKPLITPSLVKKETNFCPPACLDKINEATGSLNLKSSGIMTETIINNPAPIVINNHPKEYFIPIDGAGSTTNGNWIDINGMEVYVDRDKYPAKISVYFEGSLKVKDNNGEAHARLFNVTKNVAADNSEISSIGSDYKRVSSGKINLAGGSNLYRVQMFSITQYEVSIQGAKIKITVE